MKHALLLFSLFILNSAFAQVAQTQFGAVQGSLNGTVHQFLGIPFAKPPVGNLRWKAPENPTAWVNTLPTTAFAPECPQKKYAQGDTTYTLEGNEDCLYLNVWSPQLTTPNLPVMVFIHGGGNQQGSASEVAGGTQFYIGKNLSERGNVVVVTIQYRLGPLGFLVHPGLEEENVDGIAGNYAARDQILALKWVQNNIANFGGDPTKVMIFGESAGGVNVGNLLTSPLADGLFQRACIESATPLLSLYAVGETRGVDYVNTYPLATGTNAQKIAYLRSLPADSIIIKETSPVQGGVVQMGWQSVIDNQVFTGLPTTVIQSGNFNNVPLMVGSNADEMSISAPQTVVPAMVTALISAYFPQNLQATATALYPPGSSNAEAKQSYIGILTDGQFTVNARRTAECVSKNQEEPVWRYFFSHKHTVQALQQLGSYHGMELFYVFNNWENATLGQGILFKPADDSVQQVMLNYWVNFAATGNPNGNGFATWPEYDAATDCYMELKATPNGGQCGLRTAKSDLWDEVVNYQGCTVSAVDEEGVNAFSIYPNPATNNVTINWQAKGNETATIRMFDMSGKQVLATNKISPGYIISTQNMVNGLYFMQVILGDKIVTKKLVVQH